MRNITIAILAALVAASAQADNCNFSGTGSWSDATKWSTGTVPTALDEARILKGASATLDSAGVSANTDVGISWNSTGAATTLNIVSGGSLSTAKFNVASRTNNIATVNVNGGSVTATGVGNIGGTTGFSGAAGELNISNGGSYTSTAHLNIGAGDSSSGTVTVDSNGMLSLADYNLSIGVGAGSTGTLTINGGIAEAKFIYVGNASATGQINIDGGTLRVVRPYANSLVIDAGSNVNITDGVLAWDYTANQKSDDIQALVGAGLTFSGVTRTEMLYTEAEGAIEIGTDGGTTLWAIDVADDRGTGLHTTYTWATIPEPATLGLIAVFGGGIIFIRRFMSM